MISFLAGMITIISIISSAETSCTKRSLTKNEIAKKIQMLPEVQNLSSQLKEQEVSLLIRQESSDSSFTEFSVGESTSTHMVLWNRFRVDNTNGDVFVFDAERGDYISLAQWRQEKE